MPISKLHKEKKLKNYTILALLILLIVILLALTYVKLS